MVGVDAEAVGEPFEKRSLRAVVAGGRCGGRVEFGGMIGRARAPGYVIQPLGVGQPLKQRTTVIVACPGFDQRGVDRKALLPVKLAVGVGRAEHGVD